ncbi:hypothetical protein FOXG_14295 [Fusarium oxysporum f. sp. lycopersici 4287]|uniref:Uncharacterized protein n=2 Tax=Fusarium oxysporum TaxID=5507 RepID=A0A0J9VYB7_FUSO4|nr:hypothetical protein FOXG_14295 [Fusarium oxysporum f. sp. lycopersici 4287]KNB15984.1 hypothetical protein FOXG_14295 [Fusarium oxysporum f. sp. lycopersici 4287]
MRTSTAFSGMTVVFGVSIRTIYLSGNWSLLFKLAAGDARLARRYETLGRPYQDTCLLLEFARDDAIPRTGHDPLASPFLNGTVITTSIVEYGYGNAKTGFRSSLPPPTLSSAQIQAPSAERYIGQHIQILPTCHGKAENTLLLEDRDREYVLWPISLSKHILSARPMQRNRQITSP